MQYALDFTTLADFYTTLYHVPARLDRQKVTPRAVTARLLATLNHLEKLCRSVLITGSKGKGSTALFLSALIERAGARVGRFISPHLFDYRERIVVDGHRISEADLLHYGRRVLAAANALEITHPDEFPRFFEVTTAIAYLYFYEKQVDVAVIETGIGAMTDATNQHAHALSILTHIEDEHGDLFGTINGIAEEKSGVIKENTPLILGDLPESVDQLIMARAAEVGAPVTRFKREYMPNNCGYYRVKVGDSLWITDAMVKAKNAWIALTAFAQLGFALSDEEKVAALSATTLPARQEVVSQQPFVIIDSAHSQESAISLANYVKKSVKYPVRRKILLLSFSAEKNILPVFSAFGHADRVVVTRASEMRSLAPEYIRDYLQARSEAKIRIIEDPEVALEKTLKNLKPDDVLVVTGSVYLAGLASRVVEDKKLL